MAAMYEIRAHWDITMMVENADDPSKTDAFIHCSSTSLKAASPVFTAMVNGNWPESKTWSIRVQAWDIEALLAFFRLIHGDGPLDLTRIDITTLNVVFDMANYYDSISLFDGYTMDLFLSQTELLVSTPVPQLMEILYVAWTYRSPKLFRSISSPIVNKSEGPITS
ncbi:hypothetical protein BJX62DRAFT_234837 [Aspergillus germanicus]